MALLFSSAAGTEIHCKAKLLLLLLQLTVTVKEPKTKEVTKGRNSQTTSPPPLQ
jgi:hypothetical protein